MGVYLVNFLVYSMAMVGLLFVCLMIYKKTMLNTKCTKNGEKLTVENALNLSQRKTIYVIKAGEEKFLIAADTERTTFLAKLEDNKNGISQIQNTVSQRNLNNMISKEYNNIPDKPVDYSEVMAAVQKTSGFKKQAVMKEMLSKLSQPILQNDKTN